MISYYKMKVLSCAQFSFWKKSLYIKKVRKYCLMKVILSYEISVTHKLNFRGKVKDNLKVEP